MPAAKLGLLLPVLLVAGCTSSGPVRALVAAPENTAVVERNHDGTVTLRSLQTHVVSLLPMNQRFSGDRFTLPSLYVLVTNGGHANVTLQPADISAYAADRRVALLDPPALQDRIDREQAAAGTSVSYPISNRDASQPAEEPRGYHANPDSHRTRIDGTTAPRPNDPTRPKLEPFNAPPFKVPSRLVAQALQPQVIRPGDVGGGRVMFEAQDILSGLPLKVVVNVAGEKHEFLFEVQY